MKFMEKDLQPEIEIKIEELELIGSGFRFYSFDDMDIVFHKLKKKWRI